MAKKSIFTLIVSSIVVMAACFSLHAQSFPLDGLAHLREGLPSDINSWNSANIEEFDRRYANLIVDLAWEHSHPTKPKPSISVEVLEQRIPPELTSSGIKITTGYFDMLDEFGTTLGHDIFVAEKGPFTVSHPLLNRPYALAHLAKAQDPPALFYQTPYFQERIELINCPGRSPACLGTETVVTFSTRLFLIAHETGHYVYGHVAGIGDALVKEKQADAFAWDVLKTVAQSLHPGVDFDEDIDLPFFAAPIAALAIEQQMDTIPLPGAHLNQDSDEIKYIDQRLASLYELAGGDADQIRDLLPETPEPTHITVVHVSWDRKPDFLVIDDVRFTPEEVAQGIRLTKDSMRLLAVDQHGVASTIVDAATDTPVALTFHDFANADSKAIETYYKSKNWEALLLCTTGDSTLRPNSSSAVPMLNEALYRLGAASFIDLSLASDPESKRQAEKYQRIDSALTGWGFGP